MCADPPIDDEPFEMLLRCHRSGGQIEASGWVDFVRNEPGFAEWIEG